MLASACFIVIELHHFTQYSCSYLSFIYWDVSVWVWGGMGGCMWVWAWVWVEMIGCVYECGGVGTGGMCVHYIYGWLWGGTSRYGWVWVCLDGVQTWISQLVVFQCLEGYFIWSLYEPKLSPNSGEAPWDDSDGCVLARLGLNSSHTAC